MVDASLVTRLLEILQEVDFTSQVCELHLALDVLVAEFEAVLFTLEQFVVRLLQLLVFHQALLLQFLRLAQKLMELTVELLKDCFILDDGEVELCH